MKKIGIIASIALVALALTVACSSPTYGNNPTVTYTISASSGTLTGSNLNWSLNMGYVPQYATESLTLTLTNSGSTAFSGTVAISGNNASDFSQNAGSPFSIGANSTNSFTGSFTPSAATGTVETGVLTITPAGGTPITVDLQGTSGESFEVLTSSVGNGFYSAPNGTQVIPSVEPVLLYGYGANATFTISNVSSTATITLTGSPIVSIAGTSFSISTQPSLTLIGPSGSTTFQTLNNNDFSNLGPTGTITITGRDSTTNALFTFSFAIQDDDGG